MHFFNISGASTLWGKKKTQFLAGLAGKGRVTPTLLEVKIFSRGRSIKTLFIFFYISWRIPGVVYCKLKMLMLKGHAQTTQRKWKWRMMHTCGDSASVQGLISGQELLCIWRLNTTNTSAMNGAVCKTLSWKSVLWLYQTAAKARRVKHWGGQKRETWYFTCQSVTKSSL